MDMIKPAPGRAIAMALRVLRFPLTLLVIEAVAVVLAAAGVSTLLRKAGVGRDGPAHLLGAMVVGLVVIGLWKALRRWLEGAADAEFTAAGALRELGGGLALGFLLFSAMACVVMLLGGMRIEGVRGAGQIWALLAMAVTSGVFEEALFRGVLFRHVEAMLGSWAALAFTSALFGAAHLGNPGASLFAAFAIAVEAGILLGAAYMLTRRLWLAVGIHAAWNFTQGWVFSIPVSGGAAPLGLLITRREGPDWLTGGDFGLEASVVAVLAATLAGLALLRMAIRRGELRAPMWAASRRV